MPVESVNTQNDALERLREIPTPQALAKLKELLKMIWLLAFLALHPLAGAVLRPGMDRLARHCGAGAGCGRALNFSTVALALGLAAVWRVDHQQAGSSASASTSAARLLDLVALRADQPDQAWAHLGLDHLTIGSPPRSRWVRSPAQWRRFGLSARGGL